MNKTKLKWLNSKLKLTFVLTIGIAVSGCVSLVRVQEEAGTTSRGSPKYKDLEGIPFFVKAQICHQTTTYTQTWLEVGFSIENKVLLDVEGEPKIISLGKQPKMTRRVDATRRDAVRDLQDLILGAASCQSVETCDFPRDLERGSRGEDVKCLQRFLKKLGLYEAEIDGIYGSRTENAIKEIQSEFDLDETGVFDTPIQGIYLLVIQTLDTPCDVESMVRDSFANLPAPPRSIREELVGNFIEPKVVVNYQRELRLNGKLPWFGDTTLTTKHNADGTLSETTTTVATKTAESLSSLIPLKEYLTGEYVEEADDADLGAGLVAFDAEGKAVTVMEKQKFFELSVEEKGYVYTFEADYADPDNLCAEAKTNGTQALQPIAFNLTQGIYKRAELKAKSDASQDKKDAIEFSGNVTLPKPKESK